MKFCLVLKDNSIIYIERNDLLVKINEKEECFDCSFFLNGELKKLKVVKFFCDAFDLKVTDLFIL